MENEIEPVAQTSEIISDDKSQKQDDKVAYTTYQKVLSEKKKQDSRIKEMQDQLANIEAEKMQATGKKDELITLLTKQLNDAKSDKTKLAANFGTSLLEREVALESEKLGCVNSSVLMKVIGEKIFSQEDILGDDFKTNSEALKAIINEAKKDFPYLFKTVNATINDLPVAGSKTVNTNKSLAQMTKEELIASWKKI